MVSECLKWSNAKRRRLHTEEEQFTSWINSHDWTACLKGKV